MNWIQNDNQNVDEHPKLDNHYYLFMSQHFIRYTVLMLFYVWWS